MRVLASGYAGNRTGRWRHIVAAIAITTFGVTVAACSSGTANTAANSANLANSDSGLANVLKPPTTVGTTTSLPSRPPTGKTIVAMACSGLPPCEYYLTQFKAAADALGWKAITVAFQPTPEDILNKFRYAVSLHPDAIVINGVPRATFQNALINVHIPVIEQDINDNPSPPVVAVQNGVSAYDSFGALLGKWAVADSRHSAHAVLFTYANFPIGQTFINAAAKTIQDSCSQCSAKVVVVDASTTGTSLPSRVVSELQQDPKINYVLLQDGGMASGLIAALRGAGLFGKVRVAGAIPDATSLQDLQDGNQAAYVNLPLGQEAWQAMDGFARYFLHVPQPQWTIPAQVLVKGSFTAEDGHVEPPNYQDKFLQLWKVG